MATIGEGFGPFHKNAPFLYQLVDSLWSTYTSIGYIRIKFDARYRDKAISQALHHLTEENKGERFTYNLTFQLDHLCTDPSEAVIHYQRQRIQRFDFKHSMPAC